VAITRQSVVHRERAHDTFGERLDMSHNSLNALRLFLAALVIVSHAPPAGGFGHPPMIGDVELGGWAVAGFFVISGWLITQSRERLPFGKFFSRRFWRIFPAFWASLVLVAFVLSPLTAWKTHGEYDLGEAIGYIWHNAVLHVFQPTIPGTLDGLPYTSRWNLSLWTLQWEFACYLGIGLFLVFAAVRRRSRGMVFAAWLAVTVPYAVTVALSLPVSQFFAQGSRLSSCFLFGAVLYEYRDRVRLTSLLAAASVVALALMAWLGVVRGFGAVPLGYLTMWLAVVLPLQQVGRRNDISYGVYVYAFPLQLTLTAFGAASLGLAGYTALSVAAVVPVAWLSWRLIEKPAQHHLKDWSPTEWLLRRRAPAAVEEADGVARTP
jgi:peptidoglycan/LPS O-acetylase OafA/YrhL